MSCPGWRATRRTWVALSRKAQARGADENPTQRLSRCITGADRGGGLSSPRAHGALRPRGPARRRSDARSRSAPVAAASPLATEVRPPTDSARGHTCASRRGPCRRGRRVARLRAALADPGDLTPCTRAGPTARRPVSDEEQIARRLTGRMRPSEARNSGSRPSGASAGCACAYASDRRGRAGIDPGRA